MFRQNRGRNEQLKYLKGKWLTVKIQIPRLPLIVKRVAAVILFVAVCTLYMCFKTIKQSNNQPIRQSTNEDYAPKFKDCSKIYFDFGSNIGVQTRKLFEPNLYPNAKILSFFDETYGDFAVRRESVCSFGFEANPMHKDKLDKVQNCYLRQGWNANFEIRAVGDSDDEYVSIWSDPNSTYEDWGAGLDKRSDLTKEYKVQMIDTARFIRDTVDYYNVSGSNVFMKMDIEGSEYFVLEKLIKFGILCKNVVGSAVIEWHKRYKDGIKKNENVTINNHQELLHRIKNASGCVPTAMVGLDDESYLHDGMDYPCDELN